MCRALKSAKSAAGISEQALADLVGVSQAAVWKWLNWREPDYPIVVALERGLGLPQGTLFAAAGCAPAIDAVSAVELDPILTASQKKAIIESIEQARGRRKAPTNHVDAAALIQGDPSLREADKDHISATIRQFRDLNLAKAQGSRR